MAGTNTYKLYEVMYEEEMKNEKPKNLLPRGTHACFLEELVSNLMFPEETAKHLAMLKDMDNSLHQRFPGISLVCQEETNISKLLTHTESASSE